MKRRYWVGMLLVGVLAGLGSVLAYQGYRHVQQAVEASTTTMTLLQAPEPLTLSRVREAQTHLATARDELAAVRPWVTPWLSHTESFRTIPGAGNTIADTLWIWSFADAATEMAAELLTVGTDIGAAWEQPAPRQALLTQISALQQHLQRANDAYSVAQTARTHLAPGHLPEAIGTRLAPALDAWDTYAPHLAEGLPLARDAAAALPQLLGHPRPVTYLLLLQTSDELRATGGFITGVGTLTIEDGILTAVQVQKVTDVEQERPWQQGVSVRGTWTQPPVPLSRYMGLGHWVLRDANWSADFPTSARQVATFWQQEQGQTVDGVIAINESGLEALLSLSGPLTLENGAVLTAETLKAETLAYVYQGTSSSWGARQSDFSTVLANALIPAVEHSLQTHPMEWIAHIPALVASHNVMFTSFHAEVLPFLDHLGILGRVAPSGDDYFYLVEQNVSYSKLSPFIEQQLAYTVTLDSTAIPLTSTMTITATNRFTTGLGWRTYPPEYYKGGRWNPTTRQLDSWEGYYGGFTSLYLPPGSALVAAEGWADGVLLENAPSYSTVGGYIGVPALAHHQTSLTWEPVTTPTTSGIYTLLVPSQPGAPVRTATVAVLLPAGYRAVEILPTPVQITTDSVEWHTTLERDIRFSLRLEQVGTPSLATPPVTPKARPSPSPEHASVVPAVERAFPDNTLARRPAVPVRLEVPRLGVDAVISPVGLDETGAMVSPATAAGVAWYQLGPRPGERSNAVLAGHVDWQGAPGIFQHLSDVQPGDDIRVTSRSGLVYTYTVFSIEAVDADNAPIAAIFGATAEPTLTLITCTGSYDTQRQQYEQRLVVRALLE